MANVVGVLPALGLLANERLAALGTLRKPAEKVQAGYPFLIEYLRNVQSALALTEGNRI